MQESATRCKYLDINPQIRHRRREMTKAYKLISTRLWDFPRSIFGRFFFRRSLRPTDVFIVTHPRSGTTWMRSLIGNALVQLVFSESCELGFKNHLYVPDVNKQYFRGGLLPNPLPGIATRFFSTHAPYDPLLPKVIYIIRDPRDVMVSYYHLNFRTC